MDNRIFYNPKEKIQFKTQKKRVSLRTAVIIASCAVAVVGLAMTVRMREFQINAISLQGLSAVREDDVRKEIASALDGSYLGGMVPYRFLLSVPTQYISNRLKERFPLIAQADVKKEFPNALAVAFTERELFGVLCNDAVSEEQALVEDREVQCAYLDTSGIAYQKAPQTQGFLLMKVSVGPSDIPIGSQVIDTAVMRRMLDLNKALPSTINSAIMSYQIPNPVSHELHAVTKDGFSLLMKQDDDMNAMLYVLKTVLTKEIGSKRKNLLYIDLRFGNKVFYKFK